MNSLQTSRFHSGFTALYKSIFKPVNLYVIIGVYAIAYVATLYHRFIQIDENWFGEQAYWLVNEGVVKLKSMPGILDFDQHMYLYHKLLVWIGALVIKLCGWSVFNFKWVTLAIYLSFFPVFYHYHRKNRLQITFLHFWLATTLLVLVPILLQQSFIFRPEVYVMTSGFVSFYFLDNYLKTNKLKWLTGGAFFCGLTFLITLNAIIFPIAGLVLLLINRRFKAAGLFILICGTVSLLFTVDLWQGDHFRVFLYQAKNWPTRKFGETYVSNGFGSLLLMKLTNLLNEHQRFFWSDRVMAFSAMFLLSYIFNFNYLRKNYSSLFVFVTTLILALNLTGSHIAERYLIFYYPFMALITAIGMLNTGRKNLQYLQYIFVILILMNFASLVKQFAFVFRENENSAVIHHELFSHLPDKDALVFAPWKFIYNDIADRHIVSYQALQYYQDDLPEKMNELTFTRLLKEKYGVKYLILDRDITRKEVNDYDWYRGGVSADNPYLEKILSYKSYVIYCIKTQ